MATSSLRSTDSKPKDVLLIGDSMLRKIQISGHPLRIWKFCYPGATAEELHRHILTEKLPGEAYVGVVLLHIGTNDISRSRGQIRTTKEVLSSLQMLLLRIAKMYPQALIYFMGILPRLDCDNVRVQTVNSAMRTFAARRDLRYCYRSFSAAFQDVKRPSLQTTPIKNYFRDSEEDVVHLSHSGTQVFQDLFNRFFQDLPSRIERNKVENSHLMWQSEWERFNYWNLKTPSVRKSSYLERKRLTNFTMKQYEEIQSNEMAQKTTDI